MKRHYLWDYKKVRPLKELERIGMFFPLIGRDKDTVLTLYENLDKLKLPEEKRQLILFYYDLIQKNVLK